MINPIQPGVVLYWSKSRQTFRLYLKFIWEQFGMMTLFMELAVTIATIFWQACFSKFGISMCFLTKKNNFLAITFPFFDHFSILLLVLTYFLRHHVMFHTSKETLFYVLYTFQVSLFSFNNLGETEGPSPGRKTWKIPVWIGLIHAIAFPIGQLTPT